MGTYFVCGILSVLSKMNRQDNTNGGKYPKKNVKYNKVYQVKNNKVQFFFLLLLSVGSLLCILSTKFYIPLTNRHT